MASNSGGENISARNNSRSSKQNDESNGNPATILHDVEHFKQRYSWDCGVSCVLMLLSPEQRTHFLDNFDTICQEEGFGRSTWTIDLCYLLKRFGIKHCMYSTMIGVNEEYKNFKYYDSIIDLDRDRVQARFELSLSSGVRVRRGALSAEQLRAHVLSRGPAILLVDAGLLACDLCKHNKLKVEFRRCFGGTYTGHYILLVGYSSSGKCLYRDPAVRARLCAAPAPRLAAAAAARGTDRDVVLVYRDYSSGGGS